MRWPVDHRIAEDNVGFVARFGCNGSTEMGQTASLAKLLTENKDCKWIYRFRTNPGMPRGGIVPPSPVLAPGSASGRVPALPDLPSRLRQCNPKGYDRANSFALDLARRLASALAATLSQSFSQKSRGMQPLYWLGVPSRRLQRLNLLPIRSIALIQVTLLRQKIRTFAGLG